jgi:hypothetical protein
MAEHDAVEAQSRKLNVIIALLFRILTKDGEFTRKKRKGTGDLAVFLKRHGLEYQEIAAILDSPVPSVRELVSRGSRKRKD